MKWITYISFDGTDENDWALCVGSGCHAPKCAVMLFNTNQLKACRGQIDRSEVKIGVKFSKRLSRCIFIKKFYAPRLINGRVMDILNFRPPRSRSDIGLR